MRNVLGAAVLGATIVLGGPSTAALAWGHDGHRIVAAIAFKLLPPDKAAALDQLLKSSEVNRSFADAAGFADDVIRGQDHRHVFSPWHFVDWPVAKAKYSKAFCKPDCVINELPIQIQKAKTATNPEDKALALSWILHLVGDMHQPLHVADRKDRGGNDFKVTYRGKQNCGPVKNVELHKVWDDCLVFEVEAGKTWQQAADEIRGNLTTYKGHPAATGTITSWAADAHKLARTHAYSNLKSGADLSDAYINKAAPVVRDQLLKAGVRLAKILDENL